MKIATDPRVNGYQRRLASMVYKFFNERTKGSGINNKGNILVNSQLAEELHKPIIKNFNDKLDIPKLGTLPTDVAKLTNKVANDLVEKTDFNSKRLK